MDLNKLKQKLDEVNKKSTTASNSLSKNVRKKAQVNRAASSQEVSRSLNSLGDRLRQQAASTMPVVHDVPRPRISTRVTDSLDAMRKNSSLSDLPDRLRYAVDPLGDYDYEGIRRGIQNARDALSFKPKDNGRYDDPNYAGSVQEAKDTRDALMAMQRLHDSMSKLPHPTYEDIPVFGEEMTPDEVDATLARFDSDIAAAEREYGADHAYTKALRNARNEYAANPSQYRDLNLEESWEVGANVPRFRNVRDRLTNAIKTADAEIWTREQAEHWDEVTQEAVNAGWEFGDEDFEQWRNEIKTSYANNAQAVPASTLTDMRLHYTKEEAAVYAYLDEQGRQDDLTAYVNYLQPIVAERRNAQIAEDIADESPAMRTATAIVANPYTVVNGLSIMLQDMSKRISGSDRPVDYQTFNNWGTATDTAIGTVAQELAEYGTLNDLVSRIAGRDVQIPGVGDITWGDVYTTAVSRINSIVSSAVFGKNLALPAMVTQVGGQAYVAGRESGLNEDQAMLRFLSEGVPEGITEFIQLDSLFGAWAKTSTHMGIKGLLAIGLREAAEESVQEMLNPIMSNAADRFFLGEDSEYNRRVEALVAEGYDRDTAENIAQDEAWGEVLKSGLLALVGGGGSYIAGAPAASFLNTSLIGADIRKQGNQQTLASLMSTATGKDVKAPKTAYGTGRMYNDLTQNGEKYAQNIARDERDQAILEYYKQMRDAAQGEQADTQTGDKANAEILKALQKLGRGKNISYSQQQAINADKSAKATQSAIKGDYLKVDNSKSRAAKAASEFAYALPAIKMQPKKGTVAGAHAQADERLDEMNVDTKAKTTTVNGEEVKVTKVANVAQNDTEATVTVKKADGSTADVKISEVTFGKDSRPEAMAYAQDLDTPELANAFIFTTKDSRNLDEIANAMHHAYEMAKSGFNFASVQKTTLTNGLSEHQLQSAYDLGVADKAKAVDTQQAAADARQANNASKAWQSGRINMGTVVYETLSNEQKRNLDLIDIVAGLFGMNVEVFESRANAKGRFTEENGSYNKATNTIRLDINAGRYYTGDSMAQTAMLRTMSHELTHAMQRNSPKQYAAYKAAVLDVLERQGANIEELVDAKLAADSSLKSRDEAMDEVVADASETMLRDSDAIERLRELHPEQAKTFAQKVLNLIKRIKDAIREAFGSGKLTKEAQYAIKELDKLAAMWSDMAVATAEVSGREYATGSEDTISNTEAFNDTMEAVQNQARPPYTDGTKACTEFVESLNTEAKATYDLLYNFYQASRLGKQNLSSKFMYYDQWNEKVKSNPAWAERAKAMADTLPDEVRRKMNMNTDGTLNPTSLEVEFKMNRSMGQRIIDALETEVIDTKYAIEGTEYTLSKGNATIAVGGEAYRRAICEEVRKAYHNGTLKQAGIGTLSKDRWGSLGFLASNGKTGASGDFTTLCPQMFYNKGCHYCYRLAALKSGVNNKLVGANVWYGGEILRIKDADIDRLNKNGGLRIQSFGDWMPQFSSQLADMLYDADMRGLQIKIITKEPSMIEYVALLREQGLGKSLYFNLSADYAIERAGNRETADYTTMNTERPYMRDAKGDLWWKRAMTVQEANKYRQKYDWVNTRIVATTQEEFIRGLKDPTVDVVTGYHGNIREWERIDSETGNVLVNVEALGDAGMPRFAFDAETGEWSVEYEDKTSTHKALATAIAAEGLQYEYYIKTCCITGRCATCEGKCGRLAKDFNIKNATNRDAESVAYWQQQMEYDEAGENKLRQDDVQYSARVSDPETLRFLDNQETVTTYKTMQVVDGKLYPPMAAVVAGNYEDASELGAWEQATEHPELIKYDKGKPKFVLKKGKGKGDVPAAYNPYMHSSNLVLNDQFSSAYNRPNLVTVECEVPVSELTSGYHAQYAKDSVGWHSWHTGTVAGALRKAKGIERQVLLSRWIKPVRIVPDAEVAQMYKELLDGTGVSVPDNVVPPNLLNELEKAGVSIAESGKVDRNVQLQARSSLNDGIELTAQEFAMFYDKWGEIKADKSAAFEKTSDGYYIFAIGDKLVYTNGNYDNPKIAYAVEIALADETDIDTARHLMYETERGEISYEQTRRILEDLFGEENVRGFDTVIHRADERKNRRGKGATRREIYRRTESEENLIYQARSPEALSDREILANALEDVATTPEEKLRLAAYKEGLAALNEKQAELDKNKAIIRELMFKKGRTSEDSERLLKARNRAEMLAKEVDKKDKALLNLERMEPIKAIVKREGDKVRKERNAVMKERIADVRQGHENAALRKSITRRAKRLDELVRVGDKSKFVPDNLRDAVADVVSIFAQDDSVFGKKENAQGIPRWQRLQNAYEAIRQTSGDIARQYDEAIAEKLKYLHDTLDGKNIKALNGVQLKAVRDVLMSFQKLISDGNKIFRAGRAELIEDMSNEFIEDASRAKGFYAWSGNSVVKWVRDEMAIPPYFFKRLGGVFEKLGNDILRAESDWGLLVGEYNEKVHEIYKKYHHKDWANKKGDTLQFTTDSGTAIELTREQALSIYAISERQRRDTTMNSHHLDVGGIKLPIDKDGLSVFKAKKLDNAPVPISAKDVTKITAWLTEEQIGYANAMVELMSNDLAKLGNVASRQLHGWEKFQEEFYFPYVTDKSFFNTQLGKTEQLLIKDLSHAKGLAENATSPLELTDFTQTANRHIANMILYSTFAVPQDNFMRLYDHHLSDGNTIKDRMRATYGEWTNKYIEQLMKDMYGSSPKTTSENVVDEMLGKIRNNTIKNRVLFSRTVTVQQFSSVFRAMYLINPKYFVHAPNIGGWKEAQKYAGTAVIKKMGGFDIKNSGNVVDMLMNESWGGIEGDNVLGKIVDAVDKGAGIAPATADAMTWGAIWQAVKREQAAKTGLSIHSEELKQLAGKRFDEVTRFTQVYGSTLTKSPMMRSSSAIVRALTTYQGETTLSFNMAYDAIWNKKNTAGQKARAFAFLLITLTAGAISKSLVTAIGDDDDEESVYGERVLRDFTGEMVGNFIPFNHIPIASQIWSELQGFTTTRDEFAFVSNFVKVVEVIGDEDATLDKKLRSIASFGSSMTRVPFYNIYREIKRSGDLINDIQNNGDKEKREGWATNAALSGALDQIPFYSEFAPTPVERIYTAALEGDSANAERYREYMKVYKGKDDKQINSSLRSEIKSNYENGEIDDETAIRLLTDYAGMEADEAYMKVEEWEYEYSGNGDWKKTAKVTDAIESGDDKALAAAVEELVEYGGYDSPKDAAQTIASSITSTYKPLYIAASPAERKRMKAMLLDAYETVYETAGLEFYRDSRSNSIDKWLE